VEWSGKPLSSAVFKLFALVFGFETAERLARLMCNRTRPKAAHRCYIILCCPPTRVLPARPPLSCADWDATTRSVP
jgi:hypothetical protein